MKRLAFILFVVIVTAALATPTADAQCGSCGHHRGLACGRGPHGPGPGAGPMGMRGFQHGGPMYDVDSVTTLSGKVVSVDVAAAGPGRMGGTHVVLQDGNKKTEVHLGPAWFLEQQGFAVSADDSLEVTGSLVRSGDSEYLIAREAKTGDKTVTLRNAEGIPAWSRGPRR